MSRAPCSFIGISAHSKRYNRRNIVKPFFTPQSCYGATIDQENIQPIVFAKIESDHIFFEREWLDAVDRLEYAFE